MTGDIAYSGARTEYDSATDWLSRLADAVGCPEENVWTVPGNHDIDRAVVRGSQVIQGLHRLLRECELSSLDEVLQDCLERDRQSADFLLSPLAAYNEFASKFGCAITAEQPFWETDFELGPGSALRLRGMTTTFVSDHLDHADTNPLLLGGAQYRLPGTESVAYMTMGHHPPSWLRDGTAAAAMLDARSAVQLWGHRHMHAVDTNGDCLRVHAGALQPYRDEKPWEPRYNFLLAKVDRGADSRALSLTVHGRRWSDQHGQFRGDPESPWQATIAWPELRGDLADGIAPSPVSLTSDVYEVGEFTEMEEQPDSAATIVRNRSRRLAFRFTSLPYETRLEIMDSLGLLRAGEYELPDQALTSAAFARAKDAGAVASLWDAVEAEHGDSGPNPFRTEEPG